MAAGDPGFRVGGWKLLAAVGIPVATYGGYKLLSLQEPEAAAPPPRPPVADPPRLIVGPTPPPPIDTSSPLTSLLLESLAKNLRPKLSAEIPGKSMWVPPPDSKWLELVRHPNVVLIIGRRGAGKSGLGYRILELSRSRGEPYIVGLPSSAQKLLPDWVGTMDRLENVPPKAVVLLDEAHLVYDSRSSMGAEGRDIGSLINLSRQKAQTLIFVVPEARELDINVVSQIDVLAVKELSDLSSGYERPQLRRLTDKARAAFRTMQGDLRGWTWVYSESAGYEGLVSNELASFWSPRLSRAFVDTSGQIAPLRRGRRPSREELKQQAREMHEAGL